ncbi:hypothetical protein [Corallococcus llansteffanensis]|uniref:Outer membrane protein beta-barrel domain-containing protein n=1 Tax=Corallococcus llansteffanensis TaxID=2316731 RepID=A0A3A8NZW0_9BACT|nr:hypothetical protein [Corallococcus llansteffanensis]RKH49886.1 hypothetical protein D7V93_31285 [Corallococcus llansteffanensis]
MVTFQQWSLLLVSLVSTSVLAEEGITTGTFPVAHRNVVTLSVPLQGLDPQVALEGEHVLGERVSVGLGVSAYFTKEQVRVEPRELYGIGASRAKVYELGLAPSMRFYLTGTAPRGLWVSPRVEVGYGQASYTFGDDKIPNGSIESGSDEWFLGAMGVVGYSVVLEPGFTLQGGVGVGARRTVASVDSGSLSGGVLSVSHSERTTWRFTERLVLNVGWAF